LYTGKKKTSTLQTMLSLDYSRAVIPANGKKSIDRFYEQYMFKKSAGLDGYSLIECSRNLKNPR